MCRCTHGQILRAAQGPSPSVGGGRWHQQVLGGRSGPSVRKASGGVDKGGNTVCDRTLKVGTCVATDAGQATQHAPDMAWQPPCPACWHAYRDEETMLGTAADSCMANAVLDATVCATTCVATAPVSWQCLAHALPTGSNIANSKVRTKRTTVMAHMAGK